MKKRVMVELDIENVIENAIEKTIENGLNEDKEELISMYDKETFNIMQIDFRTYGTLFSINFKENLEKELENIINKIKEN